MSTIMPQKFEKHTTQTESDIAPIFDHIRSESPTAFGNDEDDDECPALTSASKGKNVTRTRNSNSFPGKPVQNSVKEADFYGEGEGDESSPYGVGRHYSTHSQTRKSADNRLSSNSEHVPHASSASSRRPEERSWSVLNSQSHGCPPFDHQRSSHHTNAVHAVSLPVRSTDPANVAVKPLPYLSIQEARRWRIMKKQQHRTIFGKKNEPDDDFTLLDRLSGRDHVGT